jgi:hypothetical protein
MNLTNNVLIIILIYGTFVTFQPDKLEFYDPIEVVYSDSMAPHILGTQLDFP